nr:unnamed protein product [Digitaria exilis]
MGLVSRLLITRMYWSCPPAQAYSGSGPVSWFSASSFTFNSKYRLRLRIVHNDSGMPPVKLPSSTGRRHPAFQLVEEELQEL